MTADNIAIILGINLLWTQDRGFGDIININPVLTTMIAEEKQLFPNLTKPINNDEIWKAFHDSRQKQQEQEQGSGRIEDGIINVFYSLVQFLLFWNQQADIFLTF